MILCSVYLTNFLPWALSGLILNKDFRSSLASLNRPRSVYNSALLDKAYCSILKSLVQKRVNFVGHVSAISDLLSE